MSADPPAAEPKPLFEKLGAGLPVALTAIATILAGMSTGELSRAMYWRSAAAQDQAKANDQWSLAGFKRDRSLMCETTAETLKAVGGYRPVSKPEETPTPEVVKQTSAWMRGDGSPPTDDAAVAAVLQAVHDRRPELEVLKLARRVDTGRLEEQIDAATKQAFAVEDAFKREMTDVKARAYKVGGATKDDPPAADLPAATALRYEVDSRRYKAESTANQWVGFLYEVRVKTSTAQSDRHRTRSENFFFAMLAAQVGGVGASLALARKQKSLLWLVAGLGGLAALGFGVFVYLTM